MMLKTRPFLTALLALAIVPAWADTVYKTVDKEGNTSYSGSETEAKSKEGKAGKTTEMSIDPNLNVMPSNDTQKARDQAAQQRRAEAHAREQEERAQEQQEMAGVEEAEEALRAAEAALAAGSETQPGDFMGSKDGGVRPSPQRLERLNRLQGDVERARQQLEEVRSR